MDEKELTSDDQLLTFEERMKRRVLEDEQNGEEHLGEYHRWCKQMYQFYHNAQNFESLKKKNKFPSTAIQEDVDQFVADARDKLFYADRPCTVFGREEADKLDAEAKQEMMDYQDDAISIFTHVGEALRDAALYRTAPYQVEYDEQTTREWEFYEEPAVVTDEMGNPILDQMGNQLPQIGTDGQPVINSGWRLVDVPVYKGANIKRLDPMNVLWTPDKRSMKDEFPIMIRGNVSKEDLKAPYFIKSAVENIKEIGDEAQYEDPTWEKKRTIGEETNSSASTKKIKYVEWQGKVDKRELYEFMIETNQVADDELMKYMLDMEVVEEGERCWAICGVANGDKVVQLRKTPFRKINGPNIVIGIMAPGENSLIGDSISRKTEAVQRAEEDMYGYLIENLKQSVNAFWVINRNGIVNVGGQPKVNKAGGVLETNTDVNNVAKRIDQPQVAGDIFNMLALFKQARQDQGGLQDSVLGKGDKNAETLGESRAAMSYASLRMRDYLKSFEDSFIRPLYEMRNDINSEYLDEEYIYRVIGDKGANWRKISPEAIRTPVDFVCESATRETNRSVIVQQLLQGIQVAPLAAQMGQPVRLDLMMADLFETGFAMSKDKIKRYFPLIAMEEQGMDVNGMMQQQTMMQSMGQPSPNDPLPNPGTEQQAVNRNEQRNNVNF